MSLFSTMNTSASGLGVSSTSMAVIGDNIANINTTGYKSNRAEFADFLPKDVMGRAGPSQLGTGASVNTIATLFGQGAIENSSNALDMAISGSGFFMLNDGVSNYYSRAGEFYVNDDGTVVNSQGLALQGYNADDGVLGATVGDLVIDTEPIPPGESSSVTLSAILSADADFSSTPLTSAALDITSGNGDTLEDAADQSDFATSITVYDSLGQEHEVTVLFERTGSNDWSWYAVVDAGEVTDTGGTTYTEGAAFTISSGTATFDTAGELTNFTQNNTSATTQWNFFGAADNDIAFQFGLDSALNSIDGDVRMLAGESAVSAMSQDGYPTGELSTIAVGSDGIITGYYTNGLDFSLGQVVLADFPAQGNLERMGNTLFRATSASGDPAIGAPDGGGRGTVIGNALEQSNVDLENEFVSMITSQRSFSANARVVNAASDSLQELVNLV